MFLYPDKAAFGRTVPKNMIYANARPSSRVKSLFVSDVEGIVWAYKLAPKTVNLPAKSGYTEIEIFEIALRKKNMSLDVLKAIDKAIPYPVFYMLNKGNKVRHVAAYKRPAQDGSGNWVVGDYFETDWMEKDHLVIPLPVALDLKGLYEQMMRSYIKLPVRPKESFENFVGREYEIRQSNNVRSKLESRLRKEKQFNRKVEINSEIRKISKRLSTLTAV